MPDSLRPHGLQPTRHLCPWDFPGKDTGVGFHFLLQGIFPTQGSNPGLLYCRQILYQLSYKGSPRRKKKKKQQNTRKTSISASLTMLKSLTVWITTTCGKFWKRWEYQTPWPASWEICMQIKKQQLEPDMEQLTGSKLGKESVKVVYCHPTHLIYMQNISCKMPGWMKHKLESRLPG